MGVGVNAPDAHTEIAQKIAAPDIHVVENNDHDDFVLAVHPNIDPEPDIGEAAQTDLTHDQTVALIAVAEKFENLAACCEPRPAHSLAGTALVVRTVGFVDIAGREQYHADADVVGQRDVLLDVAHVGPDAGGRGLRGVQCFRLDPCR
mmetsp:Transcript_19775/g.41502  ORF Transcript_19775/g.41502 Transcript_19775/m.41502 type:complete len:148 (-) Transcript_19775:42-485(-)